MVSSAWQSRPGAEIFEAVRGEAILFAAQSATAATPRKAIGLAAKSFNRLTNVNLAGRPADGFWRARFPIRQRTATPMG
jgi:hypothetical protein